MRHVQLVEVEGPPDEAALQRAVDAADSASWVVFASVAGVEAFARRRSAPLPHSARIAVVGPATAQAVRDRLERPPSLEPAHFDAAALARALAVASAPEEKIVAFVAADAPSTLRDLLRERGRNATVVAAYATRALAAPQVGGEVRASDAVAFASASSVAALARALPEPLAQALQARIAAAIGPSTAAALREAGAARVIEAATATADGLADAVERGLSGV